MVQKMFHQLILPIILINEFILFCAYGVKTCTDPTSDIDVGSVEAQSSTQKNLYNIHLIKSWNGLEEIKIVNLTKQNLKLQFSNEILASLSNLFLPYGLTNDNS